MIPAVRLATHEIDELVEQQYREAKLKRLNQVRDQASQFAKNIRQEGRDKRKRELGKLEREISTKAHKELQSIINDLEADALNCLMEFGGAHSKADQENIADHDTARQVDLTCKRQKAQLLGKEALRELHLQREEENRQKNRPIKARQHALDIEAVRTAYVVSLPPVTYVQTEVEKKEEPTKVILFDKATLFQTEYVMKEKVVKEGPCKKDAREAAMYSEMENQQFLRDKELQKMVEDEKIKQRGRDALIKEKTHTNYLRLLEALDKMDSNKPDNKEWEIESTATSFNDESSGFKAPSPTTSPVFDDTEETPVRDRPTIRLPSVRTSLPSPPPLTGRDAQQLNEIGQLLQELKEEQDYWAASDRVQMTPSSEMNNLTSSTSSSSSSSGVIVYSDDDVQIRHDVRGSVESQRRKELANALNAICRERRRLESSPDQGQRVTPDGKPPGILRRPSVPQMDARQSQRKAVSVEDERKVALKYYIQKLMDMKRAEVSKLSVSSTSSPSVYSPSSTSSSATTSTPKPSSRPVPLSASTSMTPENIAPPPRPDWSKRTEESSSAYDSPAYTDQSCSRISNASSLPLGAEAAAFRKPHDVSSGTNGGGNGLFSFAPLLDVYNDVYQAYNQRVRAMTVERTSPPDYQGSPQFIQQETLTESSFMSLVLSGTSSQDASSSRSALHRSKSRSPFSFELTLSSSSSSSSSQISSGLSSRADGSILLKDRPKKSSSSSTLSSDSSSTVLHSKGFSPDSSTTSSQDVSMPDVDEALRRLGLPSMQSVLRR